MIHICAMLMSSKVVPVPSLLGKTMAQDRDHSSVFFKVTNGT